jgi:hypothetical protein
MCLHVISCSLKTAHGGLKTLMNPQAFEILYNLYVTNFMLNPEF